MGNKAKLLVALVWLCSLFPSNDSRSNARSYSKEDIRNLRDRVSAMFHYAYQGYLDHAYPLDELKPLTCSGMDTWGSYSLTLIDSLDTLAVMGNYTEFRRVYEMLSGQKKNFFDSDINVSVFETNIRIVGGLIGAHLMAKKAGVPGIEGSGWPCEGPLLEMAEDAARRLLPAFDTVTGMPYGTVNLKNGVPVNETPITCTAGVGTFIVEFGALSRLTGNPVYEETAMRALRSIWSQKSNLNLFGNHIDVSSGKWTATDAGIGAGVDSLYEYYVKGSILLQRPELMRMFKVAQEAIEQYMEADDWHFWVSSKQGTVTMPVFQSLDAFYPGILSLLGETTKGLKSIHNAHSIWKQYGFLPEFYNVAQGGAGKNRDGYPLRPEMIESAMYLYRATGDQFLLTLGEDVLESLESSAKTECGYATVKSVIDHTLEDRMESFFLSETTKYLYLLFDEDNFIHNDGSKAEVHKAKHGSCILDAGGYVFNTEAHPIDPAALACCHSGSLEENLDTIVKDILDLDLEKLNEIKGESVPARREKLEAERMAASKERQAKKAEFERKLAEMRDKERKAVERKKELEAIRRKRKESLKREEEQGGKYEDFVITTDQDSVRNKIQLATKLSLNNAEDEDDEDQPEFSNFSKSSSKSDEISFSTLDETAAEIEAEEESEDERENQMPKFENPPQAESAIEKNPTLESPNLLIQRQSKDGSVVSIEQDTANLETKIKEEKNLLDSLSRSIKNLISAANKFTKTEAKLPKSFNTVESVPSPANFHLGEFSDKVMKKNWYGINATFYSDFQLMSCPAATFMERFALRGEF